MSNGTIPTPASNARNIAALTSAVDMLVSQFIRPAAQQANGNRETLDEVVELLSRHAEGLLTLEQRLESLSELVARTAQQQQANAQQIAQNAEAITQFDTRLEETRQLVAKNSSDFARMNTETKASLDRLIEENRAFRESQQTQLAAIIGNARRIDRLEQQAG
jgi:uncharacterized protein YoxC